MRLASVMVEGRATLAQFRDGAYYDLSAVDESLGADVGALVASGEDWRLRAQRAAQAAERISGDMRYQPVVPNPPKLLCLGLNDVDHAAESGLDVPEYPTVFARVASSLIGHREPMLRPAESDQLDYEAELAVVIGRGGRRISAEDALDHVAGYTIFNDGTVRDFQVRTPQWTVGKNFHGTGALGPHLVTTDELPAGASGLRITTQVGDETLQDGNTRSFVFDVAHAIALLSTAVHFQPGDVIAMGTPAGIGWARKPPRYLVPGERCCVSIEGLGTLDNPIVDDPTTGAVDSRTDSPLQSGGLS